MTEREAQPAEHCACGRQAVIVFVRDNGSEVGYCGLPDGGERTGPGPFCGRERHRQPWGDPAPCPPYRLRPQPEESAWVFVDEDMAESWIALPGDDVRFLPPPDMP